MTADPGIELEVLPGLERIALDELHGLARPPGADIYAPGRLRVRLPADANRQVLETLRTIVSVNLVAAFDVPRPKSLLGDADFRRLVEFVRAATEEHRFSGLRLSAAGARTPVMRRLGTELAGGLGLAFDQEHGDLLVRLVRDEVGRGWEVIARTTPRPVSARPWRVVDMPGSLNGTIAAAMVRLAQPRRGEAAVNLLCGAGTIAIEHLLSIAGGHVVGVDHDGRVALPAAGENATAAGVRDRLTLVQADVANGVLAPGSATLMYADLPYGDKVGFATENDALYPTVLDEASRLAAPGARFVVLTHDLRRFERHLTTVMQRWRVDRHLRVFQGGHRPGVWVLVAKDPI